jgi:hypothetical protein
VRTLGDTTPRWGRIALPTLEIHHAYCAIQVRGLQGLAPKRRLGATGAASFTVLV